TVYVQQTAGEGSGFSDKDYEAVGAQMLPTIGDVYREADMIVKVKEPIEPEYPLVRKGQVVFTYFHFACEEELTHAMLKSGATCIAYPSTRRNAVTSTSPLWEV
ncbi:MAG: alanine dehydrogenase, partial [Paludibacteraceae bacterium]|nr:alanine dehydrogenase [Paludibacteraceae bacterium]